MDKLAIILLVVAAVFFVLAASNWAGQRTISLISGGLFCWVVAEILTRV